MTRAWWKFVLPAAILVVGGVLAVWIVGARPAVEVVEAEPVVPLVRVMPVRPTPVSLDITSQGNVLARTEATLVAEVAGRIVEVSPSFAVGGFFDAGAVLMRLDGRDYELAVTRARAEVARAEVVLTREEAESAVARAEWQALGRGGEPPALVARTPQVAEAAAVVAAARAALAQAELQLDRTAVRAPFTGRVREKQADLGQYVGPGQPLARIYAADYAEVRLPVADDQLAFVDVPLAARGTVRGPAVTLTADFAGGTHQWIGRIIGTEGEVDPRTRTLSLIARVDRPYEVSGTRPPLAVGMFVHARISGRRLDDAVVLPRVALRDGPTPRVLVTDGDRLRFRDVTVARRVGDVVLIASGLTANDQVCVSPLEAPTDGMRVRITQDEPLTADAAGLGSRP